MFNKDKGLYYRYKYDYIPGNNGHFEKKKRQQENISKEELKENIQSNARVLNISSAFSHLVW
jgi:hypothetical protein